MSYVVVVQRTQEPWWIDERGVLVEYLDDITVVGPFRRRERAEKRAAVIRKLAEQYEDPEGVSGPENALSVYVEPLVRGSVSAQGALDVSYMSIDAEDV